MTTLLSTAIFLMSVATAQMSAEHFTVPQPPHPGVVPSSQSSDATLSSLLSAVNARTQADSAWQQAAQTVLVVPGPDLPADGLTAITEDMAVMCRILDQATAPILMSADALKVFDPFSGRAVRDRPGTQGLYLDGHGALFFVQATFPLVPSSSEQEPAKVEPSADPVWSRAVDELRGSPQKQPQPVPQYEAQKVENLKTALIKSLRHATNLRVRGPQDTLTVVISVWSGAAYAFVYTTDQQGPARFEPTGIDTSAVLVLRTTKADVDAFAKGGLTADQFTGRVQVLRSWTNSGREPAASTTLVVPSTGSRGGRSGTRW